jgi:hypothetical protein
MGCNCASAEQIKKLHELYGEGPKLFDSSEFDFRRFINKIGVITCLIFLSPILFGYVVYKTNFAKDDKISVRKLFNLTRHSNVTNNN